MLLESFRAYRWIQEAAGEANGAPSVRMNPWLPMCQREQSGGCDDSECRFQHLRDVRLNREELVREVLSYTGTELPPKDDVKAFQRVICTPLPDLARRAVVALPSIVALSTAPSRLAFTATFAQSYRAQCLALSNRTSVDYFETCAREPDVAPHEAADDSVASVATCNVGRG